MLDSERVELRYQETMKAIQLWVKSQKGKMLPEEAMGIAKAFLTQAAAAIVAMHAEWDQTDLERLTLKLFRTILQFIDEKRDGVGD